MDWSLGAVPVRNHVTNFTRIRRGEPAIAQVETGQERACESDEDDRQPWPTSLIFYTFGSIPNSSKGMTDPSAQSDSRS